jgi:hypothetical protein
MGEGSFHLRLLQLRSASKPRSAARGSRVPRLSPLQTIIVHQEKVRLRVACLEPLRLEKSRLRNLETIRDYKGRFMPSVRVETAPDLAPAETLIRFWREAAGFDLPASGARKYTHGPSERPNLFQAHRFRIVHADDQSAASRSRTSGSSCMRKECPAEIVDRVRDLRWPDVFGNSDEAVARPKALDEFAKQSSAPPPWDAVREMSAFTRGALGADRIAILRP